MQSILSHKSGTVYSGGVLSIRCRFATIFVMVGSLYGSTSKKPRTRIAATSGWAMMTSTVSLTRHEVANSVILLLKMISLLIINLVRHA